MDRQITKLKPLPEDIGKLLAAKTDLLNLDENEKPKGFFKNVDMIYKYFRWKQLLSKPGDNWDRSTEYKYDPLDPDAIPEVIAPVIRDLPADDDEKDAAYLALRVVRRAPVADPPELNPFDDDLFVPY
jgi:hypothetical protein